MEYKKTLNMPKSGFPMRAGLPAREPEMLKHWEELDLYNELLKKNEGKPLFSLHDGPPFSNGALHMGHALNKSLKDFINPQLRHARLLHPLYPRLGQPRHAHRVRHHQAEQAQPQGHERGGVPHRLPRVCRPLYRCPAGGLQAHGRGGRLGAPLQDHGPRL